MMGVTERITDIIDKTLNYAQCEDCSEHIHIADWEPEPVGMMYGYYCPECGSLEADETIESARFFRYEAE